MKSIFTVYTILLVFALVSCKKDKDTIQYSGEYNSSYRAWLDFKGSSGNSYSYLVTGGSWVGFGTETIITVKEGKIVERSFVLKGFIITTPVYREWKEDESQLGTHQEGEPLRTLDDVYTEARNNWLIKRDDAEVFFEAKNNGMISSCGYVPKNCADDCFRGITIGYIKAL